MSRRFLTAREQYEMLAPWRTARDLADEMSDADWNDRMDRKLQEKDDAWSQRRDIHDLLEPNWDTMGNYDYDDDDDELLADASAASAADEKNRDWASYDNMVPPKDYGRNGPRPPLTMEPVTQYGHNGIMARHGADERPVGHLMWNTNGKIDTVNTHPDFEGQGIANAMLYHARSDPMTYRSQYPIHHSNTLSPYGEAWARSDPYHTMPPDSELDRISAYRDRHPEMKYEPYLGPGHNYVPASVPYSGQTENYMKNRGFITMGGTPYKPVSLRTNVRPGVGYGLGGNMENEKTAGLKNLWPDWWKDKEHPDVPFPHFSMLKGEDPGPAEILRRAWRLVGGK